MATESDVIASLLRLKSALLAAALEASAKRFAYALKYSPDQPRDDRGRWTDGGGDDTVISEESTDADVDRRLQLAAMSRIARCEAQWKSDMFHCGLVRMNTCYAQAMVRFVACEKGHSIPPLNY